MRRNRVTRAGLLELGADLVVIAFVLFSTLPILWLFLTSLKPEKEIVTRSRCAIFRTASRSSTMRPSGTSRAFRTCS